MTPRPELTQKNMDIYIRVNTIGYLPKDYKIGLALTNLDLSGRQFQVSGPDRLLAAGTVGKDRGPYASFAHLYELDFSSFTTAGIFRLQIEKSRSDAFEISEKIYQPLIPLTLQFFQVQRCGSNLAQMHGECHTSDGIINSGPKKGRKIDVSGGWHDAGDYLKFFGTTAFTVDMMLSSYLEQPEVFQSADSQKTPAVLQEARVGLDWLEKMWRPGDSSYLYYQVGDISDHETWRMPEKDLPEPARPVWPVEEGKGANLAGKGAAAMAMAAVIWGDKTQMFYDRDFAFSMLNSAKSLYQYGKKRPEVQSSVGFYEEDSSSDDMALAAAELFRATKDAVYLRDARAYAFEAGSAGSLNWSNLHALAHYELAKIDPGSLGQSQQFLEADLMPAENLASRKPFFTGVDAFFWGVNENLAGLALEALWYEDLTFNPRFRLTGQQQRDYLFGANPWGVCWVSKGCLGRMPQQPHHQIADLRGSALPGFWDEGPVPLADFLAGGIELDEPDELALFQHESSVYHDDRADYMTNEPTISMNAIGLALAAWYSR
ncbi:MAG: glycoside hydrolase family 9 protein [Anaerolineaceae bacterium]